MGVKGLGFEVPELDGFRGFWCSIGALGGAHVITAALLEEAQHKVALIRPILRDPVLLCSLGFKVQGSGFSV